MTQDITDIQRFYKTTLGRHCQYRINHLVQELWPDFRNLSVLGMGYPIPYLTTYLGASSQKKAERLCVMMNAPQGIVHWPSAEKNATALIDYDAIPLADQSVDRIVMIHSLEYSETPHATLREVWRVLKSNGRVLIITPNRRSIWAQLDDTPFGHGNPYTMTQLTEILREHQFATLRNVRGLYILPTQNALIQSIFPMCDRLGPLMFQKFSGVVGIEASKQLYVNLAPKEKRVTQAAFARARHGV